MDVTEILTMVLSMVLSAFIGAFGMLMIGGSVIKHYLLVKVSRGKKVLLMGKTEFGWRSFVAKKNQNTLVWKYDGKPLTTDIKDVNISRYMRVDMIFVDADKPARAISLKDGSLYPDDFDPETFNNILIRALTRPTPDGADELKKLILVGVVLGVLILLGVIAVYVKLGDLVPVIAGGVI